MYIIIPNYLVYEVQSQVLMQWYTKQAGIYTYNYKFHFSILCALLGLQNMKTKL
jgi:hypothetical protein